MTWMGRHATVRLGVRNGHSDVLTIAGEYSPELHERFGNPGTMRMTITLNGCDLGTERITGGDFVIAMPLARRSEFDLRSDTLGISCDSGFVPALLGMGSDIRTMSVRVKDVRVGDHAILDFARIQASINLCPSPMSRRSTSSGT